MGFIDGEQQGNRGRKQKRSKKTKVGPGHGSFSYSNWVPQISTLIFKFFTKLGRYDPKALVLSWNCFISDKRLAEYLCSPEYLSGSWEETQAPRGVRSGLKWGGIYLDRAGTRLTWEGTDFRAFFLSLHVSKRRSRGRGREWLGTMGLTVSAAWIMDKAAHILSTLWVWSVCWGGAVSVLGHLVQEPPMAVGRTSFAFAFWDVCSCSCDWTRVVISLPFLITTHTVFIKILAYLLGLQMRHGDHFPDEEILNLSVSSVVLSLTRVVDILLVSRGFKHAQAAYVWTWLTHYTFLDTAS